MKTLILGIGNPILSDRVLNVTGTTSPATRLHPDPQYPAFEIDLYPILPDTYVVLGYIYVIHIEGHWASINGGTESGTFDGDIYVLICEDDPDDVGYELGLGYNLANHVVGVYPAITSPIILYD